MPYMYTCCVVNAWNGTADPGHSHGWSKSHTETDSQPCGHLSGASAFHSDWYFRNAQVSARWVPKLLTADQKRQRENMSRENLRLFEVDPDTFLKRFVTMDETWVHHFEPESKQQSKQWKHVTSPTPKKAKSVPSAGKVMASVFWDSEGVIMVDWLPITHTTSNFWGMWERKSKVHDVESWQKACFITTTMLHLTRHW